jgi:hypothetical protein
MYNVHTENQFSEVLPTLAKILKSRVPMMIQMKVKPGNIKSK